MSDRGPRWRTPPSSGRSRAGCRPSARWSRGCRGRPTGRRSSASVRCARTSGRLRHGRGARARRSACRAGSAAGPRSASSQNAGAFFARVCADQAVFPHHSGDASSRCRDGVPFELAWTSSPTKVVALFVGSPFHECCVAAGGSDTAIVGLICGYACRRGFQFFYVLLISS